MNCYPMAALERTMKIQEVILRALAEKITCGKQQSLSESATVRRVSGTGAPRIDGHDDVARSAPE